MRNYYLLPLLFILKILPLNAETRSFDRTWLGLLGKSKVSDNLFIWNELQPRLDNDRFNNQQFLVRPGLLWSLDERHELGFLYGYIYSGNTRENRPTLQYNYQISPNSPWKLSLRNRLEFRFREDRDQTSIRYRPAFRLQTPLTQKLSFITWEEPFLNLTHEEWTGERVFERNRFFVGVGTTWEKVRFEIGYMNQYIPRSSQDVVDHILTIYLFY